VCSHQWKKDAGSELEEVPLFLKILGFEKKEAQRKKKDESVYGSTEEQFPQKGSDFPAGAAGNATHGFTLNARNSDCAPNEAGFQWVAIGCALHCGFGS
jgi:hypothetical protein